MFTMAGEGVKVYVDGSCITQGNQVICGIGIYWGENDIRNRSLRVKCYTNNQAELLAALFAIKQSKEFGVANLKIITDSQYVQMSFNVWIKRWKRNGWRASKRRPVKNIQLIKAIDGLMENTAVEFRWVPGHIRSNTGNCSAHNLAVQAVRDESTDTYSFPSIWLEEITFE